jgi:hypothetical protein
MGRRDRDERPPVELWGAEPGAQRELQRVEVAPRAPRWLLAVAVLLGVLLIGNAVLAGGDGGAGDGEHAAEEDEGSSAPSSTTRRPSGATTTTLPPVQGVPISGQPVGASLLFAGGDRTWSLLDLDTGEARPFGDERNSADPSSAVAVRGGVAVASVVGVEYRPLRGPPVLLQRGAETLVSSGSPDSVWVGTVGDGGAWWELTLRDLDGHVVAGPLIVPTWIHTATTAGPIFERGGRVYLHTAQGSRFLTPGDLLTSSGDEVVVLACDERARCRYEAVDATSGVRRTFGSATGDVLSSVALSPDGGQLAVATTVDGRGRLRVVAEGGAVVWEADGVYADGPMAWLPGDLGVITSSFSVVGAVRHHLGPDGTVQSDRLAGLADQAVERVLLIPH